MNKIFFLLVIPVLLLAAGCSDNKAAENKPATPATAHYQTVVVEARPVEQAVRLPAQLAAFLQVDIFPKVNGYVTAVPVDVGSHVRQGQLLMTLEAPELVQATAGGQGKICPGGSRLYDRQREL